MSKLLDEHSIVELIQAPFRFCHPLPTVSGKFIMWVYFFFSDFYFLLETSRNEI